MRWCRRCLQWRSLWLWIGAGEFGSELYAAAVYAVFLPLVDVATLGCRSDGEEQFVGGVACGLPCGVVGVDHGEAGCGVDAVLWMNPSAPASVVQRVPTEGWMTGVHRPCPERSSG